MRTDVLYSVCTCFSSKKGTSFRRALLTLQAESACLTRLSDILEALSSCNRHELLPKTWMNFLRWAEVYVKPKKMNSKTQNASSTLIRSIKMACVLPNIFLEEHSYIWKTSRIHNMKPSSCLGKIRRCTFLLERWEDRHPKYSFKLTLDEQKSLKFGICLQLDLNHVPRSVSRIKDFSLIQSNSYLNHWFAKGVSIDKANPSGGRTRKGAGRFRSWDVSLYHELRKKKTGHLSLLVDLLLCKGYLGSSRRIVTTEMNATATPHSLDEFALFCSHAPKSRCERSAKQGWDPLEKAVKPLTSKIYQPMEKIKPGRIKVQSLSGY